MVGNYIQAIEKGADTVILTGSCGPCRFGEYYELQMNLLKKLGYNLDFIVIDAPGDIGIKELFNRIGKLTLNSKKSKAQKIKALLDAVKVMNLIDEVEAQAHYLAGYEKVKGECKRILNSCKKDALNCNNPKEMIILLMDYGISTKRRLTPSWWVKDMALVPTKLNSLDIKKGAKKYLSHKIGGHARECIGEAVLAHKEGLDGAIQIFPMGCMPEIVSKAILPQIAKDKNFPIMTLVVDEMTGEAGYVTRVEAFVDLLERRKLNELSTYGKLKYCNN